MLIETKISLFKSLSTLKRRKIMSPDNVHNQYHVISTLEAYLGLQSHELTDAEKQGLCHGLSTYYGYVRLTKKNSQPFFKLLNIVATIQDVKQLSTTEDIVIEKVLNHIRWLQGSHHLVADIGQHTPEQALAFISQDHEPVLNQHFGAGALLTLDEFRDLMTLSNNHMILINNGIHAMCVVKDAENYYMFDPDSEGLNESIFESADEVYAFLIFQSLGYQLPSDHTLIPDFLPLNLTMLSLKKQNPFPVITEWFEVCVENDAEFLQRKNLYHMNTLLLNCILNRVDAVNLLLKSDQIKPFINSEFKKIPFTPLIYCCQNRFTEIGLLLLEANANPNFAPDGHSPLKIALKHGCYPLVAALLQKGANCDMTDILFGIHASNSPQGLTPLCEILLPHFEKNKYDMKSVIDALLEKAVAIQDKNAMNFMIAHGGSIKKAVDASVKNSNSFLLDLLLSEHKVEKECIDHALILALDEKKYEAASTLINKHHAVATHGASWVSLLQSDIRALPLLMKMLNNPIDFLSYWGDSDSLGIWILKNKNNPNLTNQQKELVEKLSALIDANKIVKTAVDIQIRIKSLIAQLEIECENFPRTDNWIFRSYHDYRGNRAYNKMTALKTLLQEFTANPSNPISETVSKLEVKYPEFFSGTFQKREKDLVTYIEEQQRTQISCVPRQNG